MNKRQFVKQRKPAWKRFEKLVNRSATSKLRPKEAALFSTLLRELSNDLAIVRSRDWGQYLDGYLNHLVGRGHNRFYRAPPGNLANAIRFATVDYPRLFRKHVWYFFTAAALFFVPLAISWAAVQLNPELASRVLPSEALEQYDMMYEHDADEFAAEGFADKSMSMSGFYVYNNAGIALRAFAVGILMGGMTVYVLLSNGISIGATAGYLIALGHGRTFLAFVISHGSFELTAIAIAGGAGLMLGNAIVHPGQRTRVEAIRVQGLDAVKIAFGAAVMLFIAAGIEAFWSPAPIPAIFKYIVGATLWVVVYLYLFLAGRGQAA
jgi:uncharacterized membrane protein SpoIIM required for sporulation